MPMVASPSPTLRRSPMPDCWRIGVMPARVPCPPANDISMSAAALLSIPNTGSSRNQTRIPPIANWPIAIIPFMITCKPEMLQIVLRGGRRSPNRSEADIAITSRPGICLQTANTLSGKTPLPPISRPIPSEPSPRTRKPPMTAVGMKSLRNGLDQRRMSCARKDDREDDEREADLFRAALHAQFPDGREPCVGLLALRRLPQTGQGNADCKE